jgi:hypothetical protein
MDSCVAAGRETGQVRLPQTRNPASRAGGHSSDVVLHTLIRNPRHPSLKEKIAHL